MILAKFQDQNFTFYATDFEAPGHFFINIGLHFYLKHHLEIPCSPLRGAYQYYSSTAWGQHCLLERFLSVLMINIVRFLSYNGEMHPVFVINGNLSRCL